MKRLLGFAIGGIFLMAASAAVATPPGPGKRFDCSDTTGKRPWKGRRTPEGCQNQRANRRRPHSKYLGSYLIPARSSAIRSSSMNVLWR